MSEPNAQSSPSEASASGATSPQQSAPAKASKPAKARRTWRKRILIGLAVAAVLVVALRVVLYFALPIVINKVASAYGLTVAFERHELTLLGGDAGLWFVKVTPKSGGEPLLVADYLRGNISLLQLLMGRLVVWRVEADGIEINIERDANGRIAILEQFASKPTGSETTEQSASASRDDAARSIDLTSPLRVDAFRLHRVRATIRDKSVSPEFIATLGMDVRVSDVGSKDRPAKFEIEVMSDPMLDRLFVEGEFQSAGRKLDANMVVTMRGLHLRPAEPYLALLGLRPVGDSLAARMKATLRTDAVADPGTGISATLVLEDLSARSDAGEAAAVDKIELKADSIDFTAAKLASLLIDGVRVNASRSAGGTVRFAGIELVPRAGTAPPPAEQKSAAPLAVHETTGAAYQVQLADFRLQNVNAAFQDAAITPNAEVSFIVKELTSKDVRLDASDPDATLALSGQFTAPNLVQDIQLTGILRPYAQRKTLEISVAGQGVRLEAIRSYLDALGIESTISSGTFSANVNAELTSEPTGAMVADAVLSDVTFADGKELVSLNRVVIASMGVDAQSGRLRVKSVEITGPMLGVNRDATGAIVAAGLRLDPNRARTAHSSSPPSAPADPSPPAQAARQPIVFPRLEIGELVWRDVRVEFVDTTSDPATVLQIVDAGVELDNFIIDLHPSADDGASPGTFRAWLASPNLAERFVIEGVMTPRPSGLDISAHVAGDGLSPETLAPYLQPLGIEPTLRNASVKLDTAFNVAQTDEGLSVSASVKNLAYGTEEVELVGLDGLTLTNLMLKHEEVSVESIQIDRPRAQVGRDASGGFEFAGVRIPSPAASSSTQPTASSAPTNTAVAASTPQSPVALPVAALRALRVNDAAVTWSDQMVSPQVRTTLRTSAELDNFVIGRPADPATFVLNVAVDGSVDALNLKGQLNPSIDSPSVRVAVDASGLRAGDLAAYLNPGTQVTLTDGRFRASLEAGLSRHTEGGFGARLVVADLDYRDGHDTAPLLLVEGLTLAAARIDIPNGLIAIDEVSTTGVETEARRTPDHSTTLLGVQFGAPSPAASPERPEQQPAAPDAVSAPPVSTTSSQPAPDVSQIVDKARRPPPEVIIEKIDLNLKRATFRDESQPDAAPLSLLDWRLHNPSRIEIGGKDAETASPVQLEFIGRMEPIIQSLAVHAQAAPFAQEPNAQIDIAVTGIHGQGLTDLLPQLRDQLDGAQLTDGQFRTRIETSARLARRGAGEFDLMRGFDLDLLIADTAFRNGADGRVLAGLESLHSENIRVQPQTGSVHVKSLELTKPMGYVLRDAEGVHVLGWVVKVPQQAATEAPSTTAPAVTEAIEPTDASMTANAAPGASEPTPARPQGEIRIDRLSISGIDMTLEDRSATPPMLIPLNGLDLEVRNLTNLALVENRPIRFSAVLNAGQVEVPKRTAKGGIAGALGDMGTLLGGKRIAQPTTVELEQRELFSQIAANGQIALYPAPAGYVKSSVSGLELGALSGAASQAGVTLNGGMFDSTVDLRLVEDGNVDVKSRFVLTDLEMSEPENGPIARHVALPAPLDAVIGTLQDAGGAITLPVKVQIKQGELSGVGGAAAGAVSSVIATAFASAPAKAVGGVTEMIGLGGKEEDKRGPPPVVLKFAPADAELGAQELSEIDALIELLRKNESVQLTLKHELGADDVAVASTRANPSPQDCLALAEQARARKAQLLRARAHLIGQARGNVAILPSAQAEATLQELREVQRELAHTEDALDELYGMLRPGADRQAARRTRVASLAIGQQRLEAVRAAIVSSNVPRVSERIRVLNPQFAPTQGDDAGRVAIAIIGAKPDNGGWLAFLRLPGL